MLAWLHPYYLLIPTLMVRIWILFTSWCVLLVVREQEIWNFLHYILAYDWLRSSSSARKKTKLTSAGVPLPSCIKENYSERIYSTFRLLRSWENSDETWHMNTSRSVFKNIWKKEARRTKDTVEPSPIRNILAQTWSRCCNSSKKKLQNFDIVLCSFRTNIVWINFFLYLQSHRMFRHWHVTIVE